MTRKLYLARHADAVNDPSAPDIQRRLSEDGLANAHLMARRIKENGVRPGVILTSPALRARATADIFSEVLECGAENIKVTSGIYEATGRSLQDIVTALDDAQAEVMIIGHNPAISRIVPYFSAENLDNMPPAGIVCLSFEADNWKALKMNSGSFEWYDFPQNAILNNIVRH